MIVKRNSHAEVNCPHQDAAETLEPSRLAIWPCWNPLASAVISLLSGFRNSTANNSRFPRSSPKSQSSNHFQIARHGHSYRERGSIQTDKPSWAEAKTSKQLCCDVDLPLFGSLAFAVATTPAQIPTFLEPFQMACVRRFVFEPKYSYICLAPKWHAQGWATSQRAQTTWTKEQRLTASFCYLVVRW